MCLAVPGRVLEISERDGTRIAQVDFGGVSKEVCLEYVPDLQVGEYTIVHVGFALQRLDEQSALETLDLFRQMGELEAVDGAWHLDVRENRPDIASLFKQRHGLDPGSGLDHVKTGLLDDRGGGPSE